MALLKMEGHKAGQVAVAQMAWAAGQLPAALLQHECCESVIQRGGQEPPPGEQRMRVTNGTTPAMIAWMQLKVGSPAVRARERS